MKAAVLVEDNYQVLEVWYPYLRLKEEGINTVLAGTGEKTLPLSNVFLQGPFENRDLLYQLHQNLPGTAPAPSGSPATARRRAPRGLEYPPWKTDTDAFPRFIA